MLGNFDHRVLLCFIAVANVVHVSNGDADFARTANRSNWDLTSEGMG